MSYTPRDVLANCARDSDYVHSDQLLVVGREKTIKGALIHICHNSVPSDVAILRQALRILVAHHGLWVPSRRTVLAWGVLGGLALGRGLQLLGLV